MSPVRHRPSDRQDADNIGDRRTALRAVPLVLAMAGAAIRLWQWLLDRSLWLDEALLGNSIADRSLLTLMGEPLDHAQSVPPLFLAALKVVTLVFSVNDQALHLVPLVAGLLTPAAALFFARHAFRSVEAKAVFVGTVSLSPVLLYYSTELRPYGTDVLIAVTLMALLVVHDGTRRSTRRLMLLGVISPWVSLSAALALAAAFVALAPELRDPATRAHHLRAAVVVGASAALAAIRTKHLAPTTPELRADWAGGFPPMDASLPSWLLDGVLGLVHLTFRHTGVAGSATQPGWRSIVTVLLTVVVTVGLVTFHRSPRLRRFAVAAVLVTLAASFIAVYPFRGRLLLFLVPVCALGAAAAVEHLRRSSVLAGWAVALGIAAAVAAPLLDGHLPDRGDVPAALRHAAANAEDGDVLVPSAWSEAAFLFYERQVQTGLAEPGLLVDKTHDLEEFQRTVVPRIEDRVWLLFTHRHEQAGQLVEALEQEARLVETYEDGMLGLYLFDFASS